MSTTHQRPSSKEQFWRRVLRQWHKSGLSVRAFCATHGISEPSFYAWRRTLHLRDAEAVRFVPVRVVAEQQPIQPTDDGGGSLELVLAAGRRLRIGPGFDGPTLQRLLALLEEGRP
jgi:transposase-like protein